MPKSPRSKISESQNVTFYASGKHTERTKANLPHWAQGEAACFATFRLNDSLPQEKLDAVTREREAWENLHPQPWDDATRKAFLKNFGDRPQKILNAGHGSCILRNATARKIVESALLHFDGIRYQLHAFVVMPNHVHVLFSPLGENAISDILKIWKGFTARKINERRNAAGSLWQRESWDTLVRSEAHFLRIVNYIFENDERLAVIRGEASSCGIRGSDRNVASPLSAEKFVPQGRSGIPAALPKSSRSKIPENDEDVASPLF